MIKAEGNRIEMKGSPIDLMEELTGICVSLGEKIGSDGIMLIATTSCVHIEANDYKTVHIKEENPDTKKFKVDDLIAVSNSSDGEYVLRYFAGTDEQGCVQVFPKGKTSKTAFEEEGFEVYRYFKAIEE